MITKANLEAEDEEKMKSQKIVGAVSTTGKTADKQ